LDELAGKITPISPLDDGEFVTKIGRAMSDTVMKIELTYPITL